MPIKTNCSYCKKIFYIKPSRKLKNKSHCCSRKCKGKYDSLLKKGEKNPMFGISLKNPRKGKTLQEYHGVERANVILKNISDGTKKGMKKNWDNLLNGLKKRRMPNNHYTRLGKMCIGRRHSDETKKKISKSNVGKTLSKSAKKRISIGVKKKWENGCYKHIDFSKIWKGRKHKPETIIKMRKLTIIRLSQRKSISKIEKEFFKELKKIYPKIKTQFNFFDRMVVDGAIVGKKIIIEFFGDYWHGNPKKYPNLSNRQIGQIIRDRHRKQFILDKKWKLIIIWESDYLENSKNVFGKITRCGNV